ncbi:hypothetical protein LC653_29045 [Nostoc sp. CHAB 5784]|uniref:hypothetical protein n=1 Tax=Nostoc mirabile TaxID=2907820 RepID=UPI001E57D5E9|nr:hypothetical protein [Nostoc mirabile]MCC5667817.1 hypothetical protein [Nostoc mirabile CHAB5784]
MIALFSSLAQVRSLFPLLLKFPRLKREQRAITQRILNPRRRGDRYFTAKIEGAIFKRGKIGIVI